MNLRKAAAVGLVVGLFWFWPAAVFPQAVPKKITYEQDHLNKEPVLLKPLAEGSWLDDENLLLRERDEKAGTTRLMKVSVKTGQKTLFLDYGAFQKNLPQGVMAADPAAVSPDYSRLVYQHQKDLYLYLPKMQTFRRLTATPEGEKNPRLSPDSKYLAYTRANNLYAFDLDGGLEYQVTSDGSETISNGRASWVYYEEILGRRSQ